MLNVNFLPAEHGDCIHISYTDDEGQQRNILIDGGPSSTYSRRYRGRVIDGPLKEVLNNIDQVELLVITHIDDDHIGGILKWFSEDENVGEKVKKVWFNSPSKIKPYSDSNVKVNDNTIVANTGSLNTSTGQGKTLEEYLHTLSIDHVGYITSGYSDSFSGVDIQVLTPSHEVLIKLMELWEVEQPPLQTAINKDHSKDLKQLLAQDEFIEDNKIQNLSSISFILRYKDKKYLFLGDSCPTDVISALNVINYHKNNKIEVDFIKISHHGSKKSTSKELLEMVDTSNYVISTNGKYHGHPDKTCLARIIDVNNSAKIYTNYYEKMNHIFSDSDIRDYPDFSIHSTVEL